MRSMSGPLQLENVSVTLADREVVSDASLTLQPGRLVALVGPNGAGKTTLLRAMAGLVSASGTISVGGIKTNTLSRAERARLMAYLPQGHQVHWPLTARDVVALGRYPHGLADPSRASDIHDRAIEAAMDRTQTLPFAKRRVMDLSGGERARVMLARVFAVEAPILLADEPTSSLDPRHQITVMNDLKAESRRGTLVVVVTHDIGLASRLADEIVLMNDGRVVAHGPPQEVFTDERLAEIYGVTALRQTVGGDAFIAPWGLV